MATTRNKPCPFSRDTRPPNLAGERGANGGNTRGSVIRSDGLTDPDKWRIRPDLSRPPPGLGDRLRNELQGSSAVDLLGSGFGLGLTA